MSVQILTIGQHFIYWNFTVYKCPHFKACRIHVLVTCRRCVLKSLNVDAEPRAVLAWSWIGPGSPSSAVEAWSWVGLRSIQLCWDESARVFIVLVDFPQILSWTGFDSEVMNTWSWIGLVISSRAVEAWSWRLSDHERLHMASDLRFSWGWISMCSCTVHAAFFSTLFRLHGSQA